MSIEAMTFVLGLRVGDSTRKLILVGFANHAHKDGTSSYAKPETVAEYADCSERTVQRHLPELLAGGYMREGDQRIVAHLPPGQRPIVYDLAMCPETIAEWAASYKPGRRAAAAAAGAAGGRAAAERRWGDKLTPPGESNGDTSPDLPGPVTGDSLTPVTGDNVAPVEMTPRGDTAMSPPGVTPRAPRGDTAMSPKPSLNRPDEPRAKNTSADADSTKPITPSNGKAVRAGGTGQVEPDPGFVRFYEVFPRRVGKPAAMKAWRAAMKRGDEPAVIIAAAVRYRDDVRRARTPIHYVCHPSTWLNEQRYADDPAHAMPGSSGNGQQRPSGLPVNVAQEPGATSRYANVFSRPTTAHTA